MKRTTITFLALALLFSACGSEEASTEETTDQDKDNHSEESTEPIEEEEEIFSEIDDGGDYSIQGQWDDIIFQVGTGNPDNIDFYVDYSAETFSEEEWNYIDWSYAEYGETFGSYESFEDLPEADYFADGARVVEVYFETESDGMTFESMVMIYIVNDEGLLWIIGSEMAG